LEIRQGSEDWATEYERTAALVRKPAGTREDLGQWSDGWEWGTKWAIEGVLLSSRGRFAVLISRASSGPSPGLTGTSVELLGFSALPGKWLRTELGGANALTVQVIADQSTAAATWWRVKGDDPERANADTYSEMIELNGTKLTHSPL
jgi:hypothetical protein